jgi:hypothetical protein
MYVLLLRVEGAMICMSTHTHTHTHTRCKKTCRPIALMNTCTTAINHNLADACSFDCYIHIHQRMHIRKCLPIALMNSCTAAVNHSLADACSFDLYIWNCENSTAGPCRTAIHALIENHCVALLQLRVCMYVYMYIQLKMYMSVCACVLNRDIHMYMCVCMFVHVCVCVCVEPCIHTCANTKIMCLMPTANPQVHFHPIISNACILHGCYHTFTYI